MAELLDLNLVDLSLLFCKIKIVLPTTLNVVGKPGEILYLKNLVAHLVHTRHLVNGNSCERGHELVIEVSHSKLYS